ncbi:MAG: SHOCT-like domain-containing protein [Brevefilum sp.]
MVSTEERMRILMMIQEGKISASEGARLIEALDDLGATSPPAAKPTRGYEGSGKPRYLRVLVTDTDTGKTRVNVRLPVSLVNSGMRMGARFAPEIEGLELEDLNAWLNSGEIGQIVDIFDDEDGEHVEVFLE